MDEKYIPPVSVSDAEKGGAGLTETPLAHPSSSPAGADTSEHLQKHSRLQKWNTRIESLSGFEARGIARVLPDERQPASLLDDLHMVALWFSANISANNLAVGLLGPLIFGLGFVDSALCAVFGAALGAVSTAYMGIWGARSGCRTMVVARYFMGYYPSKICAFLNIILMEGYGTIDLIIAGQILSAVSGGSMSIAVGIVVVALIVLVITVFGLRVFNTYERYAWIPQLIILFILIGTSSPSYNTSLPSTAPSSAQLAGNRLSFFTLCFYVPNSWAAAASDFYVYYPAHTSPLKSFLLTYTGLLLSFSLVNMIGVGIASGIPSNTSWQAASGTSTGALLTAAFSRLHTFGRFCSVMLAFGVIANNIPGTYSAALGCQVMGRFGKAVPRWCWAAALLLVQLVCALAGRNRLYVIFQNFLALMGYWVMPMVVIVAEEHLLFRKRAFGGVGGRGFDWEAWEERGRLPVGLAALVAFVMAWVGAVLGMYQVWFTGPIAKLVGQTGADVGMWIGSGFAMVLFPVLRVVELRRFGR